MHQVKDQLDYSKHNNLWLYSAFLSLLFYFSPRNTQGSWAVLPVKGHSKIYRRVLITCTQRAPPWGPCRWHGWACRPWAPRKSAEYPSTAVAPPRTLTWTPKKKQKNITAAAEDQQMRQARITFIYMPERNTNNTSEHTTTTLQPPTCNEKISQVHAAHGIDISIVRHRAVVLGAEAVLRKGGYLFLSNTWVQSLTSGVGGQEFPQSHPHWKNTIVATHLEGAHT